MLTSTGTRAAKIYDVSPSSRVLDTDGAFPCKLPINSNSSHTSLHSTSYRLLSSQPFLIELSVPVEECTLIHGQRIPAVSRIVCRKRFASNRDVYNPALLTQHISDHLAYYRSLTSLSTSSDIASGIALDHITITAL